ncbi:MAG: hypothetical protein SGI88_17835 [Candidatus Hydrogenedentes bacterium]|nr:hypothetical protein [Candidatus Hydrogenedentota bacterium]
MTRLVSIVVLAACAASCNRAPAPDFFAEGEELYLKGEYDEAIERFKGYLLADPDHAGAHWYLGTCYLYSSEHRWLGIAQGELETALALFNRQGKANPIPRFNETYFEMMCHINQAKIYLLLVETLIQNPRAFPGLDARAVIPGLLAKCAEHAGLADEVSPGNPDVVELKRILDRAAGERPAEPAQEQISI